MRLTWLANAPWTSTGYGQQTAIYTTRLVKRGHAVGVIANYGHSGTAMTWNGVQVFGNSFHPYAMDVLNGHSKNFKADALVSVMDLQVFEPDALLGTKWIAWLPVDHHNITPNVLSVARQADFRICMSKHGQDQLQRNGVDSDYIPCGVDTEVFKPLDRAKCREEMGLPLDKFLVGMVAMNKGNPSRKAFNQTIAAFAALQMKYKDCMLYLHTMDGLRGFEMVNLIEVCKAFNLKFGYPFQGSDISNCDVVFAHQYGCAMGYEPALMTKLYNSFDVYTGVTMGEGFGIPLLEAQACGTPVISGDWTAMSEIHFSGWQVSRDEAEPWLTPQNAFQYMPRVSAIAEKMEAAYKMRGNEDYRKRAEKGAKAYDADKIVDEMWMPKLAGIEAKLGEHKAPASVDRNLKVLR